MSKSRFSLSLEAQEQELEIDMAIDAVDERNALAGDSLADTPFSPMVSRAFSTAVDDTDTLERMNDVLQGSDIDDIPEDLLDIWDELQEDITPKLISKNYKVSA